MSSSRLGVDDFVREIADISRELDNLKTRQFIGSNQIKMRLSTASNSTWDMSIVPNNPGQTSGGDGWKVVIVTARSINDSNLVGRLAIRSSLTSAVNDVITIPLPPSQNNMMKWFVPIVCPTSQTVQLKFQIVANDECSISFEEWQSW